MLTLLKSMAAARSVIMTLTAVFFAGSGLAAQTSLGGLESGLTDLIYRLSRSVVAVEASRAVSTSRFGMHVGETYRSEITTGIVVDSIGLVLAAARPVLGCDRLTVRYENRAVEAEVVAVDFQNELALLRTTPPGGSVPDFDQRHTCAGQMVIALGAAFGFRSSPALGFCTGVRDDGQIQFSIPNAGNWLGGGVFDLSGRLLGVIADTTGAGRTQVTAVPASRLPAVVSHLLDKGDRLSGYAGITSQEIEISPGIALPRTGVIPVAAGGSPEVVERGVVVTAVMSSSPAWRAGLAVGDLIFAVNNMPVNSASGLASLVRQSLPGTTLRLDLIRRNQLLALPLVVGRKSLNLTSDRTENRSDRGEDHLIDSLRQAIEILRDQLNNLGSRLNSLDQD